MTRSAAISGWLRRRADSRAGAAGVFVWAFAEAMVWPVIPDASIALLTAARPRRWPVLALAATAGSIAGGVTGWWATAAGWHWPLPLTTPRMHTAVQAWFADGAAGLAHQPLSGVPYKVFVAAAPDAGVGAVDLALATLRYRGVRFTATAALVALVAAVAWRLVPAHRAAGLHVGITAIATIGLFTGLGMVVAAWS
jgi:1-acyl-sn-glycerol-3-phosphate acyltransferase